MKILCDRNSGVKLSKNESINRRHKRIHINFYFVRNVVANGKVQPEDNQTKEMVADVVTKSLSRKHFEHFRAKFFV